MFSPSSPRTRWRQWAETVVDVADAMLAAEEVRPAPETPAPDPFAGAASASRPAHGARRRPGSARNVELAARTSRRPGTAAGAQPCRSPLGLPR
jgi:hypothetical protein